MNIGIYKIINKINGKYYVGSSCDLYHRWLKHKSKLNKNIHCNQHLQHAWNKYGENNFDFTIIKEINNKNILITEEQSWLDVAKNESEKVYNLTFIAGGGDTFSNNPNKSLIIKKLREKSLGNKNPMYGKHHTEKTKLKWSNLRKGKRLGKNNPNYGKHESEETKQKISMANSKFWKFISPLGELKEFQNLRKFCKENNLNNSKMGMVASGKLYHHKKWKSVDNESRMY